MNAKCLCKGISDEEMARIKSGLPDEQTTSYLSEFFAVFADNTRLRILYFLSQSEFCVADLLVFKRPGHLVCRHFHFG